MIEVWYATVIRATEPITCPVTKIGGVPIFVDTADWPTCPGCGQLLEFRAQVRLDALLPPGTGYTMAYIFACPSERTASHCNSRQQENTERDQFGTVLLQHTRITPFSPYGEPTLPEYTLQFETGTEPEGGIALLADDIDEALLEQFREGTKLGGSPVWWNTARSPYCPICGGPMQFVFQLHTAFNAHEGINLDGGSYGDGYLFICEHDCDAYGATLLWQHG